MKPFADAWPPEIKGTVTQAAVKASKRDYPASRQPWQESSEAWLLALQQHLQCDHPTTTERELEQAEQYEIAQELVLIAMRLLPAPTDQAKAIEPVYSAVHRTLSAAVLQQLNIEEKLQSKVEDSVARQLAQQAKDSSETSQNDSTLSKMASASSSALSAAAGRSKVFKYAATGVGFGLGAIALGVTGGLAAPMLIASTGGLLSFLGGSSLVLGGLFGLAGGGLAAHRVRKRVEGVDSFEYTRIEQESGNPPALVATIVCAGITLEEEGYQTLFTAHFRNQALLNEVYAVKCDSPEYLALGKSIQSWARDALVRKSVTEVIKRTAMGAVMSAVALPATVWSSATSLFDGKWVQRMEKSKKAGELLADTLLEKVQGDRPVILIGVSLGAVTIFHALLSLHERSPDAAKIVHSVKLIGLPLAPSDSQWKRASSVCCTEIVNAYSTNDWVLAVLARAAIHTTMNIVKPPAGISHVEQTFVKNVDLSEIVGGHLDYGKPDIVNKCLDYLDGNKPKYEHSTQLSEELPDSLAELKIES